MNNVVIVTLELLAMSVGAIFGFLAAVKLGNLQMERKDEQIKQMLQLMDKSTTNNKEVLSQNEFLIRFVMQEFDDSEEEDDDDDEGGQEVKEFNLRNN